MTLHVGKRRGGRNREREELKMRVKGVRGGRSRGGQEGLEWRGVLRKWVWGWGLRGRRGRGRPTARGERECREVEGGGIRGGAADSIPRPRARQFAPHNYLFYPELM